MSDTKKRTATIWLGLSAGGKLYARTAAGTVAMCRVWCSTIPRTKLRPVKCHLTFDPPPRRKPSKRSPR